jgi:hypothetical protein
MGFPTGHKNWFVSELYEPLYMLFSSQKTRDRGIYRVDQILAALECIKKEGKVIEAPIFKLAQFELWCRQVEEA